MAKGFELALADGFLFVDPLRTGGTQAGFIDLKLSAYGLWIAQVLKDREWDYKGLIKRDFGKTEAHPDPGSGRTFFFDIWSNIHYGYIGKSVGFSRLELVSGAGVAQAQDNTNLPPGALQRFKQALLDADISALGELDEVEDRAAAELGIELWDRFGAGLEFQSFLDAVRAAAGRLKTRGTQ